MNIRQDINDLLYALSIKGKIYKINSFNYYNEKKGRYLTKYQVYRKEKVKIYNKENEKFEENEIFKKKEDCYNLIDVMVYLADEYKKESEKSE